MVATPNYKPGYQISVVPDYPASPVVGDIIRFGAMLGIAQEALDSSGEVSTDFGPMTVFVPVTASVGAIAKGDPIYYVDSTTPLSNTPNGLFFGYANGAIASGSATIEVIKVTPHVVGIPKVALVTGGAAGNFTVPGIKKTDKICFVGMFTTASAIQSLSDLTSEFSISAANTITNTGGTASTGNQLQVIWLDLTA